MLSSLHIENAAVIRSLDLEFDRGFTALTGETGAGKSVILACLAFLLGAKANPEMIRSGEESMMVSGLFTGLNESALAAVSEAGAAPDEEGNLLIQRTQKRDDRSQIRLNGRQISLTVLRAIGAALIGIHGQNDTHTLTDPENHRKILDLYAGAAELLAEYAKEYESLEAVRKKIREIAEREHERERLTEILAYQIADIDAMALKEGEEEELIERKLKIRSAEKITKQAGFVYKALRGSEKGSVAFLLERSAAALTSLADVIPKFEEYAGRLREYADGAGDIAEEVLAVLDDTEPDPEESLNRIEERLEGISKLKRKYGLTVAAVLAFREKAAAELEELQNSDDLLKKLEKAEAEAYEKTAALAERIHALRTEAAKRLENRVCELLAFLDMPKVVFYASIRTAREGGRLILGASGADRIEFFISANLGAEPQPLSRIASGGELARVMLALRSAIADRDGIETVIYDEIDAGVSGKTARKIGIRMLDSAADSQVIAVTHSAQIASLADTHYLISKKAENGATETSVRLLDEDGRIAELSRILGGISVTESQKAAARDMLKERETYRRKN